MAVDIDNDSFLLFADLFELQGIEFWGVPDLPDFPDSNLDRTKRMGKFAAMDTVGRRAYGSDNMGWVIAEANQMFFPPQELKRGDDIRVPPRLLVKRQIARKVLARG